LTIALFLATLLSSSIKNISAFSIHPRTFTTKCFHHSHADKRKTTSSLHLYLEASAELNTLVMPRTATPKGNRKKRKKLSNISRSEGVVLENGNMLKVINGMPTITQTADVSAPTRRRPARRNGKQRTSVAAKNGKNAYGSKLNQTRRKPKHDQKSKMATNTQEKKLLSSDLTLNLSKPVPSSTRKVESRKPRTKQLQQKMMKPTVPKETSLSNVKHSRSSTMPGMADHGSFQVRAQADIPSSLEEKRTGSKNVTDKVVEKMRKKASQEKMYKHSATVPDSFVQFVDEIHQESRITPTEEVELGNRVQESVRLQQIYDNLECELNREPTQEEWITASGNCDVKSIQETIQDGIDAKNRLVVTNLRMVQRVVNLYIRNGLGSEYNAGDLMQEGTMALIRAAEKFEPSRGFRFSTYAMYWIRASVKRSQILQSRQINVPQRLHETHKKVQRVAQEMEQVLGRKPAPAELAKATDLTETQLERCVKAMAQQCFSLDAEITNTLKPNSMSNGRSSGGGRSCSLYDLVEAKADESEQMRLDRLFFRDDLIDSLRRYLAPHEVDLILLRYGLMDERTLPHGFSGPLTISEVSRLVGIKPDKVRRMLNSSLRQLKHLIAHEWAHEA